MASPAEQPESPEGRRRIQFKNYGNWGANLLLWGVPLAVVVFFLVANFSSESVMSITGIPFQVTCEEWSTDDAGQCAQWAKDVVDSGIPEDESGGDVMELQLKKSLYGFVDQCTAVFIFDDGATAEREVPCP